MPRGLRSAFIVKLYLHKVGGARGVMVTVVESGHGDTSSNPGRE